MAEVATRAEVTLNGCRPRPMASYLKALGVFRVVAGADAGATALWEGDRFVLRSGFDEAGLAGLLERDYLPAPLVSPWNGRGGFRRDVRRESERTLQEIEESTDPRLAPYRAAVAAAWRVVDRLGPAAGKEAVILALRNELPDDALPWLDATVALTADGAAYPPLVGSGGNLGSMDLSNNFMQRVLDVLGLRTGKRPASPQARAAWLAAALHGDDTTGISAAVGQYDPGAAQRGLVNPWDYVLLLEGALLFAAGAGRRFEAKDITVAAPFTFHPSSVGYASATAGEAVKAEVWLPLWSSPWTLAELTHLLREGRMTLGRRHARTGLDAVRAARSLGVDRGVERFERYVLAERFGQSTLAVPVETVDVHERAEVAVLVTLDPWLDRVRRAPDPPADVRSALGAVDRSVHRLAAQGGAGLLLEVLVAVARLERAVGASRRFRGNTVRPVPPVGGLHAQAWVPRLVDGTVEQRLAVAFASLRDRDGNGLRALLRPVQRRGAGYAWADGPARVEGLGVAPVFEVLAAAHVRRAVAAMAGPGAGRSEETRDNRIGFVFGGRAGVADVERLVGGDTDPRRLGDLVEALLVLDWGTWPAPDPADDAVPMTEPAYTLLAPFWHRRPIRLRPADPESVTLTPDPTWPHRLLSGDVRGVADAALRALRGALLVPLVRESSRELPAPDRGLALRLSAALLLNLPDRSARALLTRVATTDLPS
jgi:CRISPR-associated protein Csx17